MTFAELRAACIAAGITPGRSAAECEKRLAAARKPKKRLYASYGLLNATALKGVLSGNALIYQGDTKGWLLGWSRPIFNQNLVRTPQRVSKDMLIDGAGNFFAMLTKDGAIGRAA